MEPDLNQKEEAELKDRIEQDIRVIFNKLKRGYILIGVELEEGGRFQMSTLCNEIPPPILAAMLLEHGGSYVKQMNEKYALQQASLALNEEDKK